MKTSKQQRKNDGNMLIFTCVLMTLFCTGVLMLYSFFGLFFVHNRLQTSADEIALAGAQKLNEKDRLGQMNNLVARSRHLVFTSRLADDQAVEDNQPEQVRKLSQRLLEESRDGARQVELEREELLKLSQEESRQAMQRKYDEIKSCYAAALPWMKIKSPSLANIKLGTVDKMASNVRELNGLEELVAEDERKNLVTSAKAGNLYSQGKNAKLPGADADLNFHISPLPAPVKREISPARIIAGNTFKSDSPDFSKDSFACATLVKISLDVETGFGGSSNGRLISTSAAVTTGGGILQ